METSHKPEQLDKDIVYPDKQLPVTKKSGRPAILVFAGIGTVLIIALLLYSPDKTGFIDSPPPEEQLERDSVVAVAARVVQYLDLNDSLPAAADLTLPPGFTYIPEGEGFWSLETPGGLLYTSDMDAQAFGRGEI